jgi:hypothetical protein
MGQGENLNAKACSAALAGRLQRFAIVAFAATLLVCALGAREASAAFSHPPVPSLDQSLPGEYLCGSTVDSDGNLYVATFGEVKIFDDSGTALTSFSAPNACGVAVDSTGDLYVQTYSAEVTKYNPSSFPPTAATTYSKDSSINGNGILDPEASNAVAVNPATDDVYVSHPEKISSYESDGTPIDTIGENSDARYYGLGVYGANGHIYVYESKKSEILVFNSSISLSEPIITIDGSSTPEGKIGGFNGALNLAVDQSNGHVLAFDEEHSIVDEFELSGALVSQISGTFVTAEPAAVAIDNSGGANDGTVYVTTLGKVNAYGPLEAGVPPEVTIDTVGPGAVAGSSVVVAGTVDANGFETFWNVEYRRVGTTQWSATSLQAPVSGTTPITVELEISGLEPNTEYEFRLVASNAGGTVTSPTPNPVVTTDAVVPLAVTLAAAEVQSTTAALHGKLNPRNSQTDYWFEWGTGDCSQGFCASLPLNQDANAGSGSAEIHVHQTLTDLTPTTTYHFRLMAENAAGRTEGEERTFVTSSPSTQCANAGNLGTRLLPECRAWELVSPPDKNGTDVIADTSRTQAAGDGSAFVFSSLGAFGDAMSATAANDYMAKRSTDPDPGDNGWDTHSLIPKIPSLTLRILSDKYEPRYIGQMTDDLNKGMFTSFSSPTDDPNVSEVGTLSLRSDLRSPGAGSYELLSSCPLCETTGPLPSPPNSPALGGTHRPLLVGTSSDLHFAAFELRDRRTADAPADERSRLYEAEADSGEIRLAGRVPAANQQTCDDASGSPCTVPAVSVGGPGAFNSDTPHAVSSGTDGRTLVFFTIPMNAAGTEVDEKSTAGDLYVRIDGRETVKINVSERGSGNVNVSPVRFLDAAPDGSIVYFSSKEALTNDAVADGTVKLYGYDTTKPVASDNLLYLSPHTVSGGNVTGVIGSSEDGSYVYFLADKQLVEGEPTFASAGIFLWHEGALRYIGPVGDNTSLRLRSSIVNHELAPYEARVTTDGKRLLFVTDIGAGILSKSGQADYDHGNNCLSSGCREFYLYDAEADVSQCVSCTTDGLPSSNVIGWIRAFNGSAQASFHEASTLSEDGRFVFFSTAESLVPSDSNGAVDAYVFDSTTGEQKLISSGENQYASYFLAASRDGSDIFFVTRERLSKWDVDNNYDAYDARIGGGFPEPPPPPPSCQGDACQPPSPTLNDPTPASSSFIGAGNESNRSARKARCRRDARKVRLKGGKVRCLSRKKAKADRGRPHKRSTGADHGNNR